MNDATPQLPSASDIVQKYIELRDFVKAENAAHGERMKPYTGAMTALSAAADALMKQTGQVALKTEFGTAFPSTTMSVTVDDSVAFFNWVFQFNARHFLTSHVSKDAVANYMDGEGEGHPPPGVKTEKVTNINFRKA